MAPKTKERLVIDRSTPGTLKLCRWTTRASERGVSKKQEGDDFFHFATFYPVQRSNTASKTDSVPYSGDIIGVAEFLTDRDPNSVAVLQYCTNEDVHADSDAYISKIKQQTNSRAAVQRGDIVLAQNREDIWCIGKVSTINIHTMDVEHLYNDETGLKTVSTCKHAQTKLMRLVSPCKLTTDSLEVFPSLDYKKQKKHANLRLNGASRVSQKQQRLRDEVFQEIMDDRAAVQTNASTPPPSPSMKADTLIADMKSKYVSYSTYRESHALPNARYKDLVGWEYEYQQLQNSLSDLQIRAFQFYFAQMVRLHHGIGKPNQIEAKSSWYVDVPKQWYDLEASDIAAPTPSEDDDDDAGSMSAQLSTMSEDKEDDDARTEDDQSPIVSAASNTAVPPLPPPTSVIGNSSLLPVAGQNASTVPASTHDDDADVDDEPSDASAEDVAEQTNKKRSAVPAPTQDDDADVDGEPSDASAEPVAEQTNKKRSAVPAPTQDDNAGVDGEASDASAEPVVEQTNKKRSSAASSSEATKNDDPDSGVELASPTGSPVKKKSRK